MKIDLARAGRRLPRRGQRVLLRAHPLLRRFLPRDHVPYQVLGGRIYLDVRESPMMLARAIGAFEPVKMRLLSRILRPGMTFVDVGANKGDFSVLAAPLVGAGGRVLAFEPEPTNCRWFLETMRLNGHGHARLHQVALGDREGSATLHLGAKSGWHSIMGPRGGAGTVDVPLTTLDAVLEATGDLRVDVMKVDVEGAEALVLGGARRVLEANPDMVVLLDLHPHLGVDVAQVSALLSAAGFQLFAMTDPLRPLENVDAGLKELVAVRGALTGAQPSLGS